MSEPDRRAAIFGAAAAGLLASVPGHAGVRPESGDESLGAIAAKRQLVFGAAGGSEVATDLAYQALVIRQARIFTPWHSLKFDALQPEAGRFNFATADAMVDGARSRGLAVHGHTLIWNDWTPAWVQALSAADARRTFDAYIETVVPHFAGRLQSWDVVNEPFWLGADHPGTFRPGPWYAAYGPDYVARAFRRTAALDPNAKLVLNEAWTERNDPIGAAVRRSLLVLIDRLQDAGVKLDVIGLQGHLTPQIPYDDAQFADFLHEIARRGLDIYITEFDVCDEPYAGTVGQRDAAVAARTRAFLDATLAVPAVKMLIAWGLSDRFSWWRDPGIVAHYHLQRPARPLPYDDALQRKPMWFAMADAFRHRGRTPAGRG